LARYFQSIGVGNGWEMAFIVIGGLGFIWMGLWMFLYKKPNVNPRVNAAELEYIEQDNNNPEESAEQQAAANDFDNKKISFLQCFKFPQTWAVFVG
jgi:ACS family hexuronate transporter-like MFS transporter